MNLRRLGYWSLRRLWLALIQHGVWLALVSAWGGAYLAVQRALPGAVPIVPLSHTLAATAAVALMGIALGVHRKNRVLKELQRTFGTPADVEAAGLTFLEIVPDINHPLVLREPLSIAADCYRMLRTNLLLSFAEDSGKVLLVASAAPGEGKTTTTINLAALIALNGARVLTVDADLHHPTMHQHFALGKVRGLSDVLVGRTPPSLAIHATRHQGLHVLPCGYLAPNPVELLGSQTMREFIEALRKLYDWVLIDTPPVLNCPDAAVLCPVVDGVILVIQHRWSTRIQVKRAITRISPAGRVVGVVLNRVNVDRDDYRTLYPDIYNLYHARRAYDAWADSTM